MLIHNIKCIVMLNKPVCFKELSDNSYRLALFNIFYGLLLVRPEFMRIHRSYIVNMLQIDELSPAGVHTFSGMNLPVSRLLYPQLQKDYMKLLFAEREEL